MSDEIPTEAPILCPSSEPIQMRIVEPRATTTDAMDAALHWEARARSAEAAARGITKLKWVASLFDSDRLARRRLDPRRLGDRFAARQCRRWRALSEALDEATRLDPDESRAGREPGQLERDRALYGYSAIGGATGARVNPATIRPA